MSSPRKLRMELVLDPAGHGLLQLATMTFVRPDATSLAVLEDVRLALDEAMLHDAVTVTPRVVLDVASSPEVVVVELAMDAEVEVDADALRVLVDELDISRDHGRSVVRFARRWSGGA